MRYANICKFIINTLLIVHSIYNDILESQTYVMLFCATICSTEIPPYSPTLIYAQAGYCICTIDCLSIKNASQLEAHTENKCDFVCSESPCFYANWVCALLRCGLCHNIDVICCYITLTLSGILLYVFYTQKHTYSLFIESSFECVNDEYMFCVLSHNARCENVWKSSGLMSFYSLISDVT